MQVSNEDIRARARSVELSDSDCDAIRQTAGSIEKRGFEVDARGLDKIIEFHLTGTYERATQYTYVVVVEAPNQALADAVMAERHNVEEDYGFDYTLGYRFSHDDTPRSDFGEG